MLPITQMTSQKNFPETQLISIEKELPAPNCATSKKVMGLRNFLENISDAIQFLFASIFPLNVLITNVSNLKIKMLNDE